MGSSREAQEPRGERKLKSKVGGEGARGPTGMKIAKRGVRERKRERDVPLYERSEFKLLFLLPLWEDEEKERRRRRRGRSFRSSL